MLLSSVQKGIYEPLEESLEVPVKDYVPEKEEFPYVVLGEISSVEYKTKTTDGKRVTQRIFVFSTAEGKAETHSIVEQIEEALMEDELEIEGANVIMQSVKSESVWQADDGLFCGSIEFELLIDKE